MLQQINFYTAEFHLRRTKYTAEHLLWTSAVTASLCVLWSLSLLFNYVNLHWQLKNSGLQLVAAQTSLDENRRLYPAPVLNTQLQAELEKLRMLNTQQGGLLSYLTAQQQQRENQSYSALLRALSTVREPGLWLSEIKIQNQGRALTLTGYTQRASALPAYLKKLSRHAQFKGQGFALIDIHQQDAVYAFTVSSEYAADTTAPLDQLIKSH